MVHRSRSPPWTHDEIEKSGLLGAPSLLANGRADWPEGAQRHFEQCEECQEYANVDRVFKLLAKKIPGVANYFRRRRWKPDWRRMAELSRERAPRSGIRLAAQLPTFASVYRNEHAGLEIAPRSDDIWIFDSEATHLLVLGAAHEQPVEVITSRVSREPGVGCDLVFAPQEGGVVVALSSLAELDRTMWELWADDLVTDLTAGREVIAEIADRVRVEVLQVRPAPEERLLNIRETALPERPDAIKELFQQAKRAAMSGDVDAAFRLYDRALATSRRLDNETGIVVGLIGVATALQHLGYHRDALAVMDQLLEEHQLDRTWGGWAANFMGKASLGFRDTSVALAWLEEARRLGRLDRLYEVQALEEARRWEEVVALADLEWIKCHHAENAAGAYLCRARAHAELGQRAEALSMIALADEVVPVCDGHLDLQLHRLFVQALATEDLRWDKLVDKAVTLLEPYDEQWVGPVDLRFLVELAVHAHYSGQPRVARKLMRLRFVPTHALEAARGHLVAVATSSRGSVVLRPCDPGLVLPGISPSEWHGLVLQARAETEAGRPGEGLRRLARYLVGDQRDPGELLVGSDGLLAGAPIEAVMQLGYGPRNAPAVRELVGHRCPWLTPPARMSDAVASLADAGGDLLHAAAEVLPEEAEPYLRGSAVRRTALAGLPMVGLLHLGVHARRVEGRPALVLADGLADAPFVQGLGLIGSPVVLLSGCGTGLGAQRAGVEQSLAQAFLKAGAGAVIATRFKVEDREMHAFVRELMAIWPFRDAARAVALVCSRLRERGAPMRLWSAPVVY